MSENSMVDVVTTIGHVLFQFITDLRIEMPDCDYIYDENLSYETAVKKFRDDNNLTENPRNPLPLFAFRRTVLRHIDKGIGKRAISAPMCAEIVGTNEVEIYRIVHGRFDIEFEYYTTDIQRLERFEIAYLSEEGFSGNKRIVVDLNPLGLLTYFLKNEEPLQSKSFSSNDNYYKAINGVFGIEGFFPVFKTTSQRIIEINSKINTFLNYNLSTNIITE